jgi:4a-hydroxytetrahydrobiopterin dehydratase
MKPPPLTPAEIDHALMHLPGWKWERDALVKTLKFVNFREALAYMLKAGFEADALNHHPEWTNIYNKLVIRLTTHDSGDKVTSLDVALAMKMQALCGE